MAVQVKEEKPKESHLQKCVNQRLKVIEKELAEVEDLITGNWFIKHLHLSERIIERTRTMSPREAIAYLEGAEPEAKALAKKAKKSRDIAKLLKKQDDLFDERYELNQELKRIKHRDLRWESYL